MTLETYIARREVGELDPARRTWKYSGDLEGPRESDGMICRRRKTTGSWMVNSFRSGRELSRVRI